MRMQSKVRLVMQRHPFGLKYFVSNAHIHDVISVFDAVLSLFVNL